VNQAFLLKRFSFKLSSCLWIVRQGAQFQVVFMSVASELTFVLKEVQLRVIFFFPFVSYLTTLSEVSID
jgi:hypothetical protein